jgi:hypothetical protein
MAGAEADLRDVHLDHLVAVVGAPALMEQAPGRALDIVQRLLDLADRVAMQMVELEEHRPLTGLQLIEELEHRLPGPIIALDEARAGVVGRVSAIRPRHIGAGRAVVVLDQRIDLKALEVRERSARVIGHGVAIARIGGVLRGAERIAGGRQAKPAGCSTAEITALALSTRNSAVRVFTAIAPAMRPSLPVEVASPCSGSRSERAPAQLPVERLLDRLAIWHRRHIGAGCGAPS